MDNLDYLLKSAYPMETETETNISHMFLKSSQKMPQIMKMKQRGVTHKAIFPASKKLDEKYCKDYT